MSEFRETAIEMAIERLRTLYKSFPTNNKENRAMKGAYVHSVEILKEFLIEEKKQIMELEELQKKYSELENKYRDSIRENNSLSEKIKEQTTLMMQLRIDLVAEMKMAKMMFEMMLAGGHTHRAKELIAKLSNHVLDLNINKAEQSIIRKIDYDDRLPF